MDISRLRAWWAHRQGLDGALDGKSAAEVLQRTGWARSVGGAAPYLTLFARAGLSREAMDRAVAAAEIHELPTARGCTYVVPASDFALALTVGQGFTFEPDMKQAPKLGATDAEIDRLCSKVVDALGKGPKDPAEIREAAGSAIRRFGPEGVRKGLSTTLPVALARLQAEGEIRRIPMNGRLDQQRYRYTIWKPNPLAKFKLSREEALTELARRYFSWIGPATAGEFQAFAGLGVRAAKAAMDPLGLVALETGDIRVMLPADREALNAFKTPAKPAYALVSSLDALILLRSSVGDFIAKEDLGRQGLMKAPNSRSVLEIQSHGIFDRGRLIGLWEFEVSSRSVAWTAFVKSDAALKQAIGRMEAFVRDQLGDARQFSLDSPQSRAPRIEALRKAAAG